MSRQVKVVFPKIHKNFNIMHNKKFIELVIKLRYLITYEKTLMNKASIFAYGDSGNKNYSTKKNWKTSSIFQTILRELQINRTYTIQTTVNELENK